MKTGTLLENMTAFSIYDKNTGEWLGERKGHTLGAPQNHIYYGKSSSAGVPLRKGHTEFNQDLSV